MREYLDSIRDTVFLIREEELRLCKLKDEGNKEAREKLIESVLPYAVSIAKKMCKDPAYLMDAIEEANMAVIIAVDKFIAEKSRLTTWVTRPIVHALKRFLENHDRLIRIPNYLFHGKGLEKRKTFPTTTVKNIIKGCLLFDEDFDKAEEEVHPSNQLIKQESDSALRKLIVDGLESVPERECQIFLMYYYDGLTLKEIGNTFGVTIECIRQINQKILRTLSHVPGLQSLEDYHRVRSESGRTSRSRYYKHNRKTKSKDGDVRPSQRQGNCRSLGDGTSQTKQPNNQGDKPGRNTSSNNHGLCNLRQRNPRGNAMSTAVAKDEVTVTELELAKVLRSTTRSQKVGLTHRKVVDLYKKGNPLYGRVEVVQNIRGHINADYSNSVRKATGDDDFKASKRAWGTRIEGTPLVEHNGKHYIEVKCEGKPGKKTYLVDGVPADDVQQLTIVKHLKKKSTDEPVVIRDIPVSQLLRLRMGGTTYRVKRS